jgi:hypothetical protein
MSTSTDATAAPSTPTLQQFTLDELAVYTAEQAFGGRKGCGNSCNCTRNVDGDSNPDLLPLAPLW